MALSSLARRTTEDDRPHIIRFRLKQRTRSSHGLECSLGPSHNAFACTLRTSIVPVTAPVFLSETGTCPSLVSGLNNRRFVVQGRQFTQSCYGSRDQLDREVEVLRHGLLT